MPSNKFLSAKGGTMTAIDRDGAILWDVAIPPGMVDATPFLELLGPGEVYRLEAVTLVAPKVRYAVGTHPDREETGANPDFHPTLATENEIFMRNMVKAVQVQNDNMAKMLAAITKQDVIPQAPAVPGADDPAGAVVE